MFWTHRKGKRYLYATHREGGRVFKTYLGSGPLAEAKMAAEEAKRALRTDRAAEREREETLHANADRATVELFSGLDLAARASLLAAGYHQHHRGVWRRKAMPKKESKAPKSETPGGANSPIDELNLLVLRAQRGDESVLPALRKLLNDRPDVWQAWGDLYARAVNSWVRLVGGNDLMNRECLLYKMVDLRQSLTENPGSKLEELLVQQVALGWLQATWAGAMYAQQGMLSPDADALKFADKRMDSAQRRFLAASKQLAVVRKLLKPAPSTLDLIGGASKESKPNFGGRLAGAVGVGVG